MNCYVIQVRTSHEKEIASKCRFLISKEILEDCFIPKYIKRKKIKGQWVDTKQILFPRYIFLVSNHVDELFVVLKKVPDLTKMISKKKETIYPLTDGEVAFLSSFTDEKHIVGMSCGFIEGDKTIITSGPLKGYEGYIKKIDRHKRVAKIELDIFNKTINATVGLEIISKN